MTIAADIRAAVTSWWSFNSTMNDEKGANNITANLTVSGYSAGKSGNQLSQDSRGSVALASPIELSTTTGKISLGGWLSFDGINAGPYTMGLVRHLGASTQEVISMGAGSGVFSVAGWKNAGINTYVAIDSGVRRAAYPITVQAQDSIGQIATSDQIIRVSSGGTNPAGTYFVVTTWDNGVLSLYVNAELVDSVVVDAVYTTPIYYFQVGAVGYGLAASGLEEVFLLAAKALSQAEVSYLYNLGAGVSYAELQAAP